MTSTLVGAALHDGAIGSLDERCDLYVPRLRGSAYEGVTIRNAMRMCSGVAWSEEDDGQAEAGRLPQALASRRPGSMLELLCTLPRAQPQGTVFNYSTVESCLLGALVAVATGRKLADYCAETIWGPAGMEADGYWALEAEGGLELGGAGVSACLRDVGRFGLLVAGGRRSVQWPTGPAARLARSRRPARQRAHRLRSTHAQLPRGIRLPMVGIAARADRHPCRRLCRDRRLRPVHLRQSRRTGGRSASIVRGVSIGTTMPKPRPSRCSERRCARSGRTRGRSAGCLAVA